jgi:hypothetical protein
VGAKIGYDLTARPLNRFAEKAQIGSYHAENM